MVLAVSDDTDSMSANSAVVTTLDVYNSTVDKYDTLNVLIDASRRVSKPVEIKSV